MRVLVIDDEQDALNELEKAISTSKGPNGESFEITGEKDYKKALKLIEAEPFDIVVTDMVMGKKRGEGIEVVKYLANRSGVAIVITAYPSIPNCVEAMRAGAWDYIEKNPTDGSDPFDHLLESIREACEYRLKNPQRQLTNPDSEWAQKHLIELMERYAGRLVAVLYERVVDSDISFAELSKRIQSTFPLAKPTIVSIPDSSSEDVG